jgi:hypothetical protein
MLSVAYLGAGFLINIFLSIIDWINVFFDGPLDPILFASRVHK